MEQNHIPANEFTSLKKRVDQIYYALVGNEIGQDRGLVGRQDRSDKRLADLEIEMAAVKNKNIKSNTMLNVLWVCLGFGASSLFTIIIEHAFKK